MARISVARFRRTIRHILLVLFLGLGPVAIQGAPRSALAQPKPEHRPRKVANPVLAKSQPMAEATSNVTAPAERMERLEKSVEETQKMVLDARERQGLEDRIRARVDKAFTAFVSANKDHHDALREAAKAESEMAAMWVEIVAGLLAPGIGKSLAAYANKIPVHSSNWTYRAAFVALDTDSTNGLFATGAKCAAKHFNDNSQVLFGEVDEASFLEKLEVVAHQAADEIDEHLDTLSPAQLGVLHAAFDPTIANVVTYKAKIGDLLAKYQADVIPIRGYIRYLKLVRMNVYGRYRMAVLQPWGNTEHFVVWLWISPEMEKLVAKLFAKEKNWVTEHYKPFELLGHLPDPDTEFECGRTEFANCVGLVGGSSNPKVRPKGPRL